MEASGEVAGMEKSKTTLSPSTSDETADSINIIPESLLALAKDARYIRQCQDLMIQSIESLSVLLGGRNDNMGRFRVSTHQSWFLSFCLYVLSVMAPLGQSLGMQVTGLKFQRQKDASTLIQQRRKMVGSLLLTACAGWAAEYYFNRSNQDIGGELSNSQGGPRQQDMLHGRDRRQAYERLRQQMMTRASASGIQEPSLSNGTSSDDTPSATRTTTRAQSMHQRTNVLLQHFCGSLLGASFHAESPHELPSTRPTTTSYSIATWLIRLHLAQFLITGKYPTIFHRLLGLKLQSQHADVAAGSVPANFRRMISILILVNCSSTFVCNSANSLARMVAKWLEKRRLKPIKVLNAQSLQLQLENELAKYFDEAGGTDGEVSEETMDAPAPASATDLDCQIGTFDAPGQIKSSVCTICRTERVHPAAPVSCGHVCCWNCLMQWVQNVRPECPLCRAPCRPQDVIALHHYEPIVTERM